MDPDDIQIEVEDNVLTIKGERRFEEKVDEERYYRVERRFGSFQRSLALPQGVKADEIQARLRGRHPHRDACRRPRRRSRKRIEVKAKKAVDAKRADAQRRPASTQ